MQKKEEISDAEDVFYFPGSFTEVTGHKSGVKKHVEVTLCLVVSYSTSNYLIM